MNISFKSIGKLLLTLALSASGQTEGSAQVHFEVLPVVTEGDITPEAAKIIYRKTEQILTRNSAAAAGAADVFAVQAKLTVTGKNETSGLVRDITSISGDFMLEAINKVDGSKYYSVTVPVKGVAKSGTSPIIALANAIKPTDAVYTRFVRLAREKVDEYYSEHCEEVIGRAKTLAESGQLVVAMVYLTGVPPTAPCHEEALELIAILRSNIDRVMVDRTPEQEQPVDGPAEDDMEEPVEEDLVETPVAVAPAPMDDYLGELYVENPYWDFKLRSAEYLPTSHKIKLTATVTYRGKKSLNGTVYLGFRKVVDEDGDTFDTCYVEGDTYKSFPDDIPVKVVYYIDNVKRNPGKLSFVGLSIDNGKIEIRNLPIRQ